MPGETSLNALLRTLKTTIDPRVYVFITIPEDKVDHPFSIPHAETKLFFFEAEGITMIITADSAERHGFKYAYRCRMITLDVHSSLEAVGFMAVVTTKLAEAGLSSNPVSAYYHDHLFVKEEEADMVIDLLECLARDANASDQPLS